MLEEKNKLNECRVEFKHYQRLVKRVFSSFGFTDEDANLATDVVALADLRGVKSHGASRMLKVYASEFLQGKHNPTPIISTTSSTLATANIDGDGGLGIVVAPKAMKLSIDKAKKTGIGMVTVHNCRHLGMASYHAMLPIKHKMIGLCMSGCPPRVLPTFGAQEKLGTNPISIAAPSKGGPDFVFDSATSVVSYNTMQLAHQMGIPLPPGIVADHDGIINNKTCIPGPTDSLLPLGSTAQTSSHKGYGLACLVEVLTGILSGAGYGSLLGRPHYNHLLLAININAFSSYERFTQLLYDFLKDLSETEPAPGHERVLFPGLKEYEATQHNLIHGIPLSQPVVSWLENYQPGGRREGVT